MKMPDTISAISCDDMVNWHIENSRSLVELHLPIPMYHPFTVAAFNVPEYLSARLAKKFLKAFDNEPMVLTYSMKGHDFVCTVVYRDKVYMRTNEALGQFLGWRNVPDFNTGKFTCSAYSGIVRLV